MTTVEIIDDGPSITKIVAEIKAEEMKLAAPRVLKGAKLLVRATKRTLGHQGTGLIDDDGHRASVEGAPPAKLSGDLQDSLGVGKVRKTKFTVGVEWGTGLGPDSGANKRSKPHASVQEVGGLVGRTRTNRLAPRPYIRPTVEREVRRVEAILRDG